MPKMVKLTIDKTEFSAPEGMNLIDAAETAGIHIPNLCYIKGMKGIGACRLCLVEVEGAKGMSIACNTKVKEGLVVRTDSPAILEGRKFVIDLILSMHPLDCMTCTKAGLCNLQSYAYDFDLKESSFQRKRFGHAVDAGNPFLKMDPDYCILCGRCVRVCKEQGTNVLDFMGRGMGSKVTTVVNQSLHESSCTFCGSCLDACPVNAIVEYDRGRKGREWEYDSKLSVCTLCGNACDIKAFLKDNTIQKITAGAKEGSASRYICAYGRFGFDYLQSEKKLLSPMKRVSGKLVETSWADALKIVADKLKKSKETGVVSTAGIVNEDALTMQSFAAKVLKTKNIDTTMSLYATPEILNSSQKALFADSDLIVAVGIDPSQHTRMLPALSAAIRRSAARGGKLIVINAKETGLDDAAASSLRGDEIDTLTALVKALIDKGASSDKTLKAAVKSASVTADIEAAAELFMKAENPLVLAPPALFEAAANISVIKGKALAVVFESNAHGIARLGVASEGKSFKDMASAGTNVLYAVGEVPITKRPGKTDFLVVQNSHITELANQADVLLPSATYLETSGTIVDFKGRLRSVQRLVDTKDAKTHSDIFRDVASAMGRKLEKAKADTIKKAAGKKVTAKAKPFKRSKGLDVQSDAVPVCASLLSTPRMIWLKELEKAKVLK
jgi:NADH dehydrogenase/NADH:ubiquinone oxidoreductase subunit G